MKIQILDLAVEDLVEGFFFYETQQSRLGSYFLTNLYADIESLQIHAGVHRRDYKYYHRLLCRRFPFAVFYTVAESTVFIHAVVDCRRSPAWIRKHLS